MIIQQSVKSKVSNRNISKQQKINSSIDLALNYSMKDVTNKFSKDYSLSVKEAERHMLELKRFLVLCGNNKGGYGMKGPIDNAWHCFISFTNSYSDFCSLVAGRFIHHTPNTGQKKQDLSKYTKFLLDYKIYYNSIPPEDLWPVSSSSIDCDDCTGCSSCRGF